jgi:hypothetical protein
MRYIPSLVLESHANDHGSQNLAAFKGIEKQWVPIFLGGLMKLCDNKPPIQIVSKYLLTSNSQFA